MKKTKNQAKESASKGYLRLTWSDWNLNFHDDENGIDGEVTICENEEVKYELSFGFQLKSTEEVMGNFGDKEFSFPYDTEHLRSFLKYSNHFLFIIYDCQKKNAYWINIHDYFRNNLEILEKQEYVTLKIPLKNVVSDKTEIIENISCSIPLSWIQPVFKGFPKLYPDNPKFASEEDFRAFLSTFKKMSLKYSIILNDDLDISKESFYSEVLLFLAQEYVSPLEMQFLWEKPSEKWSGIFIGDHIKNHIFLPLGDKRLTNTISDLLRYQYISIVESNSIVWTIDGGLIIQPEEALLDGKSIYGKVIPFVLNLTQKGRDKLYQIYGSGEKVDNAYFKKYLF